MFALTDCRSLPRASGVYIFHFRNGKKYVGMTALSIRARVLHHYNAALSGRLETPVRRAIAKYGAESVTVSIVLCDNPAEIEQQIIATLRRRRTNLYNLTNGGEGRPGFKAAPETVTKISHSLRNSAHRWRHKVRAALADPKVKARQVAGQKRSWTPERRRRMAEHTLRAGVAALRRKLTEVDVHEIVRSLEAGASCASLGREYGVTAECISHIKLGKNWAHVTGIARSPERPGASVSPSV